MSELDLRQLRYFVGVAEARSFTEAARHLFVAQPTLSQGIERLERLVGSRLFDRGPRGSTRSVVLTDAGRTLLPAAHDILLRAERALRTTQRAATRTPITVGFGTNTPRDLTRSMLALAEVVLDHVPWGEELDRLRSGVLDLCFLQVPPGFDDPALRWVPLRRVGRVAVFRRDHPLAARARLEIAELADEPIVDAGSDRDFWIVNPRPGNREPRTVGPPARTAEEMMAFVSAGRGMAITSRSVAAVHGGDELAFVPVVDIAEAEIILAANAEDERPAVTAILARSVEPTP